MNFTFDLNALPDELREALAAYLEAKPSWPIERVLCASLPLFLMQNGVEDRSINQLYVDAVFGRKWLTRLESTSSTNGIHFSTPE